MITKQKIENIMKVKGKTRGVNIRMVLDFVREEKGEQGLKRVEARIAELGYPFECEDIKPMDFYKLGIDILFYLVIQETFNLKEKDLIRMGFSILKFNILMKIFMKYFSSFKLIADQAPKMFRKHFTVGSLEMSDYSKEERYIVLRERIKIDPIFCPVHMGYYAKTCQMLVKTPVTAKETKCIFKGDEYNEYLFTW